AAAELSKQAEKSKNKEEESGDERPGLSSRASAEEGEEELIQQSQAEYDLGSYSPVLLQSTKNGSYRHGFCCQFSNGIFQLWFHFKCNHYRR
ncbi:cactin-like, partial [Tachysurus ichikawai]